MHTHLEGCRENPIYAEAHSLRIFGTAAQTRPERVGIRNLRERDTPRKKNWAGAAARPRIAADRNLAGHSPAGEKMERLALAAACTRKKSLKAPRYESFGKKQYNSLMYSLNIFQRFE